MLFSVFERTEVAIMTDTARSSPRSRHEARRLRLHREAVSRGKNALVAPAYGGKGSLVTENAFLRERVDTEENLDGIIGTWHIQDVLRMISRLRTRHSRADSARAHGQRIGSTRDSFSRNHGANSFRCVDCGSLVPTLMESELFGYEKGAFTGATKTKAGLFQAANGGTIFLDEIGSAARNAGQAPARLTRKEVRQSAATSRHGGRARNRRDQPRPRKPPIGTHFRKIFISG